MSAMHVLQFDSFGILWQGSYNLCDVSIFMQPLQPLRGKSKDREIMSSNVKWCSC